MERSRVIKLDEEEKAVHLAAASADVELSQEDHQPVVHTAGAPRLGSAHTFSVENRQPSSSVKKTGRQSRKVTGNNFDERVEAATRSAAKVEDVIDVTPAASGAL